MFEKQPWMQRAGEYPRSDKQYFNLLARAVFSAGLGPKVVESRWDTITQAFHDFDPKKVKDMGEEDVGRLLADAGVIRNRRKIEAVIRNAGLFLDSAKDFKSFHAYLGGLGVAQDIEAAADALSKTFAHLGRTSALFFLFSAGWRAKEPVQA